MDTLPEILFEDNHLLIVNKRPGELVQGDKTGDVTLPDQLKAYLRQKYNKPGEVFLGLVHRLDRPVSGAVIFARTSKALTRMTALVREHDISKTYWAIVNHLPLEPEGTLVHHLKKNESLNKSFVVPETTTGAKRAELKYRVLASGKTFHLVEIELITGRHHQIRCQLSASGSIIKGDLKYGSKRSNPDGSICLHARRLTFVHPVTKEPIRITAPVPETNDWKIFANLSPSG